MRHPEKVKAFEAVLRKRSMPYVVVNERKKAMFGDAKMENFDFIVYAESGPNWLVDLRNPTPEITDGLRQWEKVFGDGFVAVYATWHKPYAPIESNGSWRFADLFGNPVGAWTNCAATPEAGVKVNMNVEAKESSLAQGIKAGLAAYEAWKNNPTPEVEGQLGLFGQEIVAAPAKVRRETKGQKMLWE